MVVKLDHNAGVEGRGFIVVLWPHIQHVGLEIIAGGGVCVGVGGWGWSSSRGGGGSDGEVRRCDGKRGRVWFYDGETS